MCDYDKNSDPKRRQCFVCEKWTTAWMSLSEEENLKLVICYECLSYGIKWIVTQGRKAFDVK